MVLRKTNVKWAPEFGPMTEIFKAGQRVYCDGKREIVPILDTDFWAKLYGWYFDIKQLGETKAARRENGAKPIIQQMRSIKYYDADGTEYNNFPMNTSLERHRKTKGTTREYSNPENPVYPLYKLYTLAEEKSYGICGYTFGD